MADAKGNLWLTIVYPESASENWQEMLTSIGCCALISPLHDKDKNVAIKETKKEKKEEEKEHDEKKAHYHVALYWPSGSTTYKNARNICDIIHGVGCKRGASLRGVARYHCHMDNPEKYQYNKEDEVVIGGLDYDEIINSASDDILSLREIFDFCEKYRIFSYRELMIYCRMFRDDWERVIIMRHRENVYRYLRSLEHDLKRNEGKDYKSIEEIQRAFEVLGGAQMSR